jgi:hypothetical protein
MTAAEQATERARNGHGGDVGADTKPQPAGRDVAKRGPDIIDEIWDLRDEPKVPLEIGDGVLVDPHLGSIALLIGGTGAGKTSLALDIAIRHAAKRGPALVGSLELVKRILGARVIGIRCAESWSGVLTGEVPREHMLQQWPDRLRVIERRDVTVDNLRASAEALQAEFPGEPLLVVVDYVQIMDNEEREVRRRVARSMAALDELATGRRAVVLALSQGSRASSRELASNERLGRETTDAGAEAAELERWSTYTIAIGGKGATDNDWTAVNLSIGKGRMGGGDMVHPGRYCGRTGAWRLAGDARPAAEVRAEREGQQDSKLIEAARRAMVEGAEAAPGPVTRDQLEQMAEARMGKCPRAVARAARAKALTSGQLVEVQRKPFKSRVWLIWTPGKAAEAGIPLANAEES